MTLSPHSLFEGLWTALAMRSAARRCSAREADPLAFRNALFLALVLLCANVACLAQDVAYMQERPPARRALVVANSTYTNAEMLPGAGLDADKVEELLRSLNFRVDKAKDVSSRAEFLQVHLLPFVQTIVEGDIVVFYFSGHGFQYEGENYLVPLQFPKTVAPSAVFTTFISARAVEDLIVAKVPAVAILLLDACRNVGALIEDDAGVGRDVAKGLAAWTPKASNVIVGYSSAAGAQSFGSAVKEMSVYTKGLVKHLPSQDQEFDAIKKEVRFFVNWETKSRQVPWFSESSSAELYLRPSNKIVEDQRKLWQATLAEGTREKVTWFESRYGTGPFGAAARQWLAENRNAPDVLASVISPAAPEFLWNTAGIRSKLLVSAFNGTVRPRLFVPEKTARTVNTNFSTDTVASATTAVALSNNDASVLTANALMRLREAVIAEPVQARLAPSATSDLSDYLERGKRVEVLGRHLDAQSNLWLNVFVNSTNVVAWVPQGSAVDLGAPTISLGAPIAEVTIKTDAKGVKAVVDVQGLKDTLKKLDAERKTITWASIATPKSDTRSTEELLGLQAVFIRAALADMGIPRSRISTLSGATESPGNIRVRLFGE